MTKRQYNITLRYASRVNYIKILRLLTNCGLKEAVDYEKANTEQTNILANPNPFGEPVYLKDIDHSITHSQLLAVLSELSYNAHDSIELLSCSAVNPHFNTNLGRNLTAFAQEQ